MGGLVRAVILAGLVALCAMVLPAVAAAATEGVKGTVTSAETSKPIEGVEACLFEAGVEFRIACGKTDAAGEYEIIGPPPGTYKVRFEAIGYTTQWYLDDASWESAEPVKIKSGEVTKNINAALEKEGHGSIAGRVVNSSGQGVGGIQVCAYSAETYRGSCTETGGNGEYAISNLGVGTYTVSFSPQESSSCEEEQGEKIRCALNDNVIGQSVNGVRVKAGKETIENVTLQTGGQISGTVTNASITHPGIGKIEVCAYKSQGEEEFYAGCAYTSSSGQYTISALQGGSYKVEFYGDICSIPKKGERECPEVYVTTYYHGQQTFKKGELVSVTTGSNTGGINESLREAFPTTPASTAVPALTGTPAVGQTLSCSQGSWSHEPTYLAYQWLRNGTVISGQTGSTYTLQAADQGNSIACVVWAGNGAGVASATSNAVAIPVPLAVFVGVKVKGSVASVTLRCPGPGACSGVLKLVAPVVAKHGKRKKTSNVTIGVASFSIAAGKSATLRVRLTGQGSKLLSKAGKHGLKVTLAGTGVKGRALTLKPAKAAKGKKK